MSRNRHDRTNGRPAELSSDCYGYSGMSTDTADVLFVTHNFPRHEVDFAGRFIWRLARLLTDQGVRIAVLCPHHPGSQEEEIMDGILVTRFRYGSDTEENVAYRGDLDQWSGSSAASAQATLRFLSSFKKAVRAELARRQPRVVHAHWWMPGGWVSHKPARKAGCKVVLTSHGTDIRMLNQWLTRFLARRVYRGAHEISTVSTWLKDRLVSVVKDVAPRISVLPMPVDTDPFHPGAKPENEIPVVLSAARYIQQKRLFDLLEAAAILKKRGRVVRFRLIGEGPLKKELHDRKFVEGLVDEITLVPSMSTDELADEYRRADIIALCSENEGFGMTLVEAQLCERPVLGVRSGGIPDIIEDGKTGVLADVGNPEQLAYAIEYLLVDREEAARLARNGCLAAKSRFDPQRIAADYLSLYGLTPPKPETTQINSVV